MTGCLERWPTFSDAGCPVAATMPSGSAALGHPGVEIVCSVGLTRAGSEFLLSPAVLDALPGVRAADDVETLMRLKDAADGAPKNSAVARAWIRFSHLDLAASNWRQLIAVMEEDRAGGRR